MEKGTVILVTDSHRGIYCGAFDAELEGGNAIRLTMARHAYRYRVTGGADSGVYALATVGPQEGSKIGPPVTMIVRDVSKIVECSDVAAAAWEAATWAK